MKKTSNGFTYLPDSFQMPNLFIDSIFRLLIPSEQTILTIACRQILGWEDGRQTLRKRIAQSVFQEKSGLSRNTLRACLDELHKANILHPVGELNGDGQEYELNTGEAGGYNFNYLNERSRRRNGNPDPSQGIAAMHAAQKQPSLIPPPVAVEGGSNFDGGGSTVDHPQSEGDQPLIVRGSTVDRQGDQPLITLKPKTKESGDIDIPSPVLAIISALFVETPNRIDRAIKDLEVSDSGDVFLVTFGTAFNWIKLKSGIARAAAALGDASIQIVDHSDAPFFALQVKSL